MFTPSHTTNTQSRSTFWLIASLSSLMLILGGMTLSLAQETRLVLPAANEVESTHATSTPDRLHGDLHTQAIDLLSQYHKVEEPPDFIQVAVRPDALRPANTLPASYDLPAPAQVPGNIPAAQPTESEGEKLQLRISTRYQDPKMLSVLNSTNMRQMTSLFLEVSQTIDARHVSPTSYEVRTAAALEGLLRALNNPEFLKVAGARGSDANLQQATESIRQLIGSQPARSAEDAMGVMQWAADTLNQQLGIRQEIVALEFLNATLDSLDKYSAFMPNKVGNAPSAQANVSTASLEERIVGVGIEMKKHDTGALIVGTVEGGSAAEAGLKRGDVLIQIGNQSLTGMGLNQIAELVSGPAGSTVDIQIDRAGKKYGATLDRRSVYVSSVASAQMVNDTQKVGYVKLKQFSESSAEDLEKAMWKLYNAGMNSLVLDLRGNPGGLLTESVEVSDLFLPSGVIVSTKGRNASDNTTETAKRAKTWNLPLVVLVDENSASASEIFAAAIQENGRGVVVGRHSYGKGTVQTHFPLNTVSGVLKLTTAKFYSPNGREMAGAGVTPDYVVQSANEETAATLSDDNDLKAAFEVVQSGQPQQLAKAAGRGKKLNTKPVSAPRVFEELPAPAMER